MGMEVERAGFPQHWPLLEGWGGEKLPLDFHMPIKELVKSDLAG